MHESDAAPQRIALIGAPIEVGTHEPGRAHGAGGPAHAGLVRTLRDLGHAVEDGGATSPPGTGLAPAPRAAGGGRLGAGALGGRRGAALGRGGGAAGRRRRSHSLSLGSVDGAMRHCARTGRPLMVLWLDAHAELQHLETSPSGNVHGMPLAALCGEPGFAALFRQPAPPPLDPRPGHFFGLRSVDAGERAWSVPGKWASPTCGRSTSSASSRPCAGFWNGRPRQAPISM